MPLKPTQQIVEKAEIKARLLEQEKAAKVPQPYARKLGRIATWVKNKLEDWRTVSPKGMEKFEEEMGSSAAKLVRWGALGVGTLVIANLSGVLDALLSYLEAGLAIARTLTGI